MLFSFGLGIEKISIKQSYNNNFFQTIRVLQLHMLNRAQIYLEQEVEW